MPAKRSSNAQKGAARANRATAAPGVANDLVGLAVIVMAIAMAVSLVTSSSAIVTRAMAEGLRLGFGEGAILVPVALVLFGVTMFLPSDNPLVVRVALGLSLVVISALSMLSILAPGAAESADVVLDAAVASTRGGYVGSAVAWALLTLVGQVVGMVVLVGVAFAGIVVCGFSISNLALRIRQSMGMAANRIARAREERHSTRRAQEAGADDGGVPWGEDTDEPETAVIDEPATSFIGTRRTSVLRRPSRLGSGLNHQTGTAPLPLESDEDVAPEEGAPAKTSRLGRRGRRHPVLDIEDARPAEPLAEAAYTAPADVAAEKLEDAAPADMVGSSDKTPTLPFEETASRATSAPSAPADASPAIPDFLRSASGSSVSSSSARRANESSASAVLPPVHVDPSPTGADAAAGLTGQAFSSASVAPVASREAAASDVKPGRSRRRRETAPLATSRPGDGSDTLTLPPLSLLTSNPNSASSASTDAELEHTAHKLQATLEEFGLTSRVAGWVAGPLVTTFKIEMGEGERVSKITNLQDDIQLSLASESVRIFAPIPGTSLVGIEIPNKTRQNVCLGDVLPYAQGGPLEFAIGRDSEGAPVVADLARMPHMLVAGTTGSGKSVLINAIIMSLIMRTTPEQVRLILVDPKRVEFSCYAGLPHLYVPVVTEPRQAASALQWAVTEMDRRLKVFERAGARDVKVYNKMVEGGKFADQENPAKPMPYLVIVIDELSDLMMVAGKDVEASIVRIAQLARAAGIHLVLATQRPSADVVTGLIKSNVDTRVALKVSSSIDSRVILDQTGAERLMGRGDMLFRKSGGVLRRVLGAYASDAEIESVVDFIREQREPDYHDEILSAVVPGQTGGGATADDLDEDDPLVWEAAQAVVDSQLGSTSGLQRRLKVGYARAGRIMDNLERKGVVGPPEGSKPREVLLDAEGLEELRRAEEKYREV